MEYLKRNLRNAGSARWDAIAAKTGVAKSLPRKIAFSDRNNPGVQTIQPLVDFFQSVDRGEDVMPELATTPANIAQASTQTIATQGA